MAEYPRISVVIPSAAAPDVFHEVLSSVFNQEPSPQEVIIVDDAMDAEAHDIVSQFACSYPVKILKNTGKGVSAARNVGAGIASGNVILFIDTDVVLKSGAIKIIGETLIHQPGYDGLVGVQSADLRFSGFFSRWKNHWMRFTYQRLKGDVHLFYTSCAAIWKDVFLKSGGFDEVYRLPSIEDTVFGAVLGRMGARILPLPEFEVEHVKQYTWRSVLKTDYNRSSALIKYTIRNFLSGKGSGAEKTSVPGSFIAGTVFMSLAWISCLAAVCIDTIWFVPALVMLIALWAVNTAWLKYLFHEEGALFLLKGLLFLPLDVTIVNAGMIAGLVGFLTGSRY